MRTRLIVPLFGLALLLTGRAPARAEGGPVVAPPAAPQPADQSVVLGTRYFDQMVRYVARGQQGIPSIRDFYTKLDAWLKLDANQATGEMRLWLQEPGNYRMELTTNNATTTKILNGTTAWIRLPDGRVQNLVLSAEGRRSITQLQDDRDRLGDIATFLAPQTLKGPGTTFVFEKKTTGTPNTVYAGNWLKVVRKVAGRSNITFWIAYETDPKTGEDVATWPGIVRVEGDRTKGDPTEDYILKDWDDARSQQNREFRYPRTIYGYALLTGPDGRPSPTPFLSATVQDIKINIGVDASRFAAPN